MVESKSEVVRQGDFDPVPEFAKLARAGLIPKGGLKVLANAGYLPRDELVSLTNEGLLPRANFKLYDRQTKTVEQRIHQLALQEYIVPRLLMPEPVSFYEPSREWHKEKAMKGAVLSMDMEGRSGDTAEFAKFVTHLPGFTKNWRYSWRVLGISQRTGRPLDTLTERQAVRRVMIDANTLAIDGDNDDTIKGLLGEVPSDNTHSITNAWSASNADPFEDLRTAMQKVAANEEQPSGWVVAIHPENRMEAAKLRGTSVDTTWWQVIQREFGSQLRIVETRAIPHGTVLGVPNSSVYADVLTTGLPVVVPIRADNLGVEFQARMIAVPRVIEEKGFFKMTGA